MNNNKERCTRENLRVEVIASSLVDDSGQPTLEETLDTAGINDIAEPYFCAGPCGKGFETWEDALDHLEEVA